MNSEQSARDPAVAEFLAELESIPWFRNIGKLLPTDDGVKRILQWEDWPGPEDSAISQLAERQQALYDEIMASCGGDRQGLSRLWGHIHETVFRLAVPVVPCDPQQDAWHAPSTAVWQAACTAGLRGLCLHLRRPIPAELEEQWKWFVRGHWPSGYAWVRADGQLGPLLVY
jgi:hypothetical protein